MILHALTSLAMLALAPDRAATQYAKKHWRVEDGLPQNYVTGLAQDGSGYLLVATSGGVARFDGVRFTPIVLHPESGISREWINVVQPAPDGSLWVASRDAGLFLMGGVQQRRHWPSESISHMIPLPGTSSMLTLGPRGLVEWKADGTRRVLDAAMRSPDPAWQGLLVAGDSQMIAATAQGVFRVSGSAVKLPYGNALSLTASAAGGGFWLGTARGLEHSATGAVRGVPGPVVSVVEDGDGNVWAATWGHGLYRMTRQGTVSRCDDAATGEFIHSLFEDREGNLWIGSRAGLSRWSSGALTPFGPAEGVAGAFSAVAGGWMGTWREGLFRRSATGVLERTPAPEPVPNFLVRAVATAPDGATWLASWTGIYRAAAGGTAWVRVPVDAEVTGQVHALAATTEHLYIGGARGLFRWNAATGLVPKPLLGDRVESLLLVADSKTLWAGTNQGLWQFESSEGGGFRVQHLTTPHPVVTSVQQDDRGRIWATTKANGIVLVDGGKTTALDQRHGLPAQPVYAILDDGVGSLWLSSPVGIFSVPLAEIDAVLAGRASKMTVVAYDQDDGMRSIECQNTGKPAAWRDANGDLWFPTAAGMIRVRPSARRQLGPPKVLIEAVTNDAQGHQVRYTATRLASPGHVEFRYRLAEGEWIDAGHEHELRYNGLAAGNHRLQIAARHNGGAWSEPVETILRQPPRFYETWWFRVMSVVMVAGLLWAAFRWRIYLLRTRYRAVLAERNRIGREWHDTLVAGFSAISWQLDTALKRLGRSPESAEQAIAMARTMVHHYRAEARSVIWDLRRQKEDETESLAEALEQTVAQPLRERGVEWKLQVEGDAVLEADARRNLLRICQEAVFNAMQHAKASRVGVTVQYDAATVRASIEDDGVGMPEQAEPGHFGIAIMRERAERFGGKLEIESQPGRTRITATIPYQKA